MSGEYEQNHDDNWIEEKVDNSLKVSYTEKTLFF